MPRLLLIKLGAIGDVLMAVPAAQAMHALGYDIDWVCGHSVAPLLQLYPWINPIPIDEEGLLLGSFTTRLKVIFSVWRALAGRAEYDIAFTLYRDSRYRILTLPLRARRKGYLAAADRNTQLVTGRHHTNEYARILLAQQAESPLDSEAPLQYPPIFPPDLPKTAYRRIGSRVRIILVPAGARNLLRDDTLRRWPMENYLELARTLLARGFEVLLAGGPSDTWASPVFSALPVTDLIGKLSLVESVSLFDSADLVISHDTGPLHMAGVTRASMVAIFGPTNPLMFSPQRPDIISIWGGEGFACRPCYDGRNFAPCTHNGCMHQVSLAMVLEQSEILLSARDEGRVIPPRIITPGHTPFVQIANSIADEVQGAAVS